MRLEPTISTLTAMPSIQMAKRDSDEYRISKYFSLKSILFIMFANLKLVLRSYTSLYGIFMSASLTLKSYIIEAALFVKITTTKQTNKAERITLYPHNHINS